MNNQKRAMSLFFAGMVMFMSMLSKEVCHGAMLELSTEELTAKSKQIITGTVQSTNSYWNTEKTLIYTDVKVKVNELIKGDAGEDTITIKTLGGVIDGLGLKVSDSAVFQPGEEVLLFLTDEQPQVSKIKTLIGRSQGKYSIKQNEITREKEIEFEKGVRVDKEGNVFMEKGKRVSLAEFVNNIKKIMEKEK